MASSKSLMFRLTVEGKILTQWLGQGQSQVLISRLPKRERGSADNSAAVSVPDYRNRTNIGKF